MSNHATPEAVAQQRGESGSPTESDVAQSMTELSDLLQHLSDLGLSLQTSACPSAAAVEQILITDQWSCPVCADANTPLCPSTGQPHRRRLVGLAKRILSLIERHVGTVYVRAAPLAHRVEGETKVRTRRRLVMSPHQLLLTFYFASGTTPEATGDASNLTAECARHLLDVLREIQVYGRAPVDRKYCLSLLKCFRSAWKQYLNQTKKELASDDGGRGDRESRWGHDEAKHDLIQCTRSALMDAASQLRRDSTNADLKTFSALLYQRLSRLCSAEELQEVKQRLDFLQSNDDITPKIELSRPPLILSDANITGSEDELVAFRSTSSSTAPTPQKARRAYGPQLPPGWYIDDAGVSRPPIDLEEQRRRERYARKEFKAQKAYEAVMNIETKNKETEVRGGVAAAINDAQLSLLAEDLNRKPPQLTRLAELLESVEDRFLEALPPRLRPRLRQEFHDVLDWNAIERQVKGSAENTANLVRFVGQKVVDYGTPAREAETKAAMAAVCADVESCVPDTGTAVANAFRFLFDHIQILRQDVAKFSLLMISTQLKQNAVEYIRDFVGTQLPPPQQWRSSLTFLQRFVNDDRAKRWATAVVPLSWTSISHDERRLRAALLLGTLDLLRSGSHTTENRWDDLPAEVFYFEKSVVFKAANTVQESTLLLLLEGTTSSVLAARRLPAAEVSKVLVGIHGQILRLLSENIKLKDLTASVLQFIDFQLSALYERANEARAGKGVQPTSNDLAHIYLTETEQQLIAATVEKMTSTESPLYITFERKVLQFMEAKLFNPPGSPLPAPIGLVTEDMGSQSAQLNSMLVFNWEVYAPFYSKLLPHLTIELVGSAPAAV